MINTIKTKIIHLLGGYTTIDVEYFKVYAKIRAYNEIKQRISYHELKAVYSDKEKLNSLLAYVNNCIIHYNIVVHSIYGKFINSIK